MSEENSIDNTGRAIGAIVGKVASANLTVVEALIQLLSKKGVLSHSDIKEFIESIESVSESSKDDPNSDAPHLSACAYRLRKTFLADC